MGAHKNSSHERWLEEAKNVVIEKGVEAVNVDHLSQKIGVAKTSFYHFFNSKEEFLDHLFRKGIYEGTDALITVLGPVKDPLERIYLLIDVVLNKNLSNELFLRQLRTYGLHNKKIVGIINETDKRRMAFLKGMLIETGMDETSAIERSSFFYIYTLGLYERIYTDPDILKDKQKIISNLKKILFSFEF